ncbi:hypothetical protein V1505DRAFT_150273 [Lipomyces doorenjongii]
MRDTAKILVTGVRNRVLLSWVHKVDVVLAYNSGAYRPGKQFATLAGKESAGAKTKCTMASQGFVENEPITLNEEKRGVDEVDADMTELASKKSPTVIDVLPDTVTRQLSVNDIELGEGQRRTCPNME